ncbi:unnamed protein product [Urochloa humidicola]
MRRACPCFLHRTHNLKPANEESIEVGASDHSAWDRTRPNMSSHQRPSSRKDICFCRTAEPGKNSKLAICSRTINKERNIFLMQQELIAWFLQKINIWCPKLAMM